MSQCFPFCPRKRTFDLRVYESTLGPTRPGLVASRSENPRSARCDWQSSSGRERSLPSAPPVLCFLRCLRPNGKPVHADAEFRPPRAHHSNHVSVARVRRTSSKSIVQVGLHRPSAQRGTPELPVLQTTKSKLVIKLKTATMRRLNSRHAGQVWNIGRIYEASRLRPQPSR
jgi:hypothetical protein